jgi:hypothetical protein
MVLGAKQQFSKIWNLLISLRRQTLELSNQLFA